MLADREKEWIRRELARDAALIGDPVRHSLLAAFANPRVLLLGSLGFLGMALATACSCRRRPC
jgi:ACS family tartrate transporter-like MFS transporter